jgi:hypothetical protein
MPKHVVHDGVTKVEFTGDLLAAVSTETDLPRWLELALYKITEGPNTGKYALHTNGRSVVYHVHDGDCNKGVPKPAGDLPGYAEPCDRCRPSDRGVWFAPLEKYVVDMEEDRPSLYLCDEASGVREQFEKWPGTGGKPSAPAQRLLRSAAQVDAGIAADLEDGRSL